MTHTFSNKFRKLFAIAATAAATVFGAAPAANAVDVDIYSGFSDSGGGAPFSGLVGSFTSPDIQFATDNGYAWHPFGLGAFGADITGTLDVAFTGTFTFSLNSDDGSALFIDGGQVIDDGGPHGPNIVSGTVLLTAGLHPFEVQFFEDFGGASGVDLSLPRGVTFATPAAVPEPGTLVLLGGSLFGAALARRRRARK